MTTEIEFRPAGTADEPAILALLQASLGWIPDDQYAAFFRWKHHQNPFGRSPSWVAVDAGTIVGFRTFLRWEFDSPVGRVRAVRAVDTATAPSHQGRGIFSKLTMAAVDAMTEEGVGFVFNTPNDQSRPGYLKMGWQLVGRLPVAVRPGSLASIVRMARARTAADKWSVGTDVGEPAPDVLADEARVRRLLLNQPAPHKLTTARSSEFLAWRYGFEPLAYRAVTIDDGIAFFRLRRRGKAVEATVCDVIVPHDDAAMRRALLRRVRRVSKADYAIIIGGADPLAGYIPLPGNGPRLTWRALAIRDQPTVDDWRLCLGDVELF